MVKRSATVLQLTVHDQHDRRGHNSKEIGYGITMLPTVGTVRWGVTMVKRSTTALQHADRVSIAMVISRHNDKEIGYGTATIRLPLSDSVRRVTMVKRSATVLQLVEDQSGTLWQFKSQW